jgi:spore coat polysaccharide biosynthesis protein SpsF
MKPKRRVVGIIQARMTSRRLSGKILMDIVGEPMLVRVVERARKARTLEEIVVATTTDAQDDPTEALCAARGYPCVRGHPYDVLDRYVQSATTHRADVIVRITGDCPLIDPDVIDRTVNAFLESDPQVDFATNRFIDDRTYPIGLDTEVCTIQALKQAWKHADQPHQREHVMPYMYEEEGRFRVLHVRNEQDYGELRWTVDTEKDLEFVRRVYEHFDGRDDFSWKDVLALVQSQPSLGQINIDVPRRTLREFDERKGD